MLRPVLITAPATRIVDLTAAKQHCRVDHADDDTLITALIAAAESYLDGYSGICGRALINQTWEQSFSGFGCLRLPVGIASSVVSVKYYDATNALQTLAAPTYQLFTDALGSYVDLAPDQSWPSVYTRADAVKVQWVAGYGATADQVPSAIVQAAKMMIGHWYENRETVSSEAKSGEIPFAAAALLAPFRRVGV